MSEVYELQILPRAAKNLGKLPKDDYVRVRDACRALADSPRPRGARKLAGRSGIRLRVGRHRVIYEVDDSERTVTILDIGHRRDIYR